MSKAPRQERNEALPSREHFAACDRHRAGATQVAEIVDGVRHDGLLEPADIVVFQHLGGPHGPFQALRPMRIAGARIDEELRLGADALRHHGDL